MNPFEQVANWVKLHPCKPPSSQFNGHLQTIVPAFRKTALQFQPKQQIINTPDGDFLEIDLIQNNNQKLLILTHGLEGSSTSNYIVRFINHLFPLGYDVLAWNMRGCGIHLNNKQHFYHSGFTQDLDLLVSKFRIDYDHVYLAGFSLGGNLTLKWLGEQGESVPLEIEKAICFSVPCHLESASLHIEKSLFGAYNNRFLKALKAKVKRKQGNYPSWNIEPAQKASSITAFDHAITAPLHGYQSAQDYYTQNSSISFLPKIHTPTVLVNALNDPMLSAACHPDFHSAFFQFLSTKQGGHCGFETSNLPNRGWMEQVAEVFFSS